MLIPTQDWRALLPRYRRVLSFGDVLDEGIRLFRQHWITFALASTVAFIPSGLLDIWLSATARYSNPLTFEQIRNGQYTQIAQAAKADGQTPAEVVVSIVSFVLASVFYCIWTAAVTIIAETYLRGGEPRLWDVYRRALRRAFAVIVGTLLYSLGLALLASLSVVLFVVTLFGGLGGIVPVLALLLWWLRPSSRKGWLKWLIIVCTPIGLLMYVGVRWSMYIAAAVLEQLGPLAALRRSSQLVDQRVFRVLALGVVVSAILGVLVYTPTLLIALPLMITSGLLSFGNSVEATITEAASIVLRILFQSVWGIIYTVMFVDLRNRREGTDLNERLTQLEASSVTAGG